MEAGRGRWPPAGRAAAALGPMRGGGPGEPAGEGLSHGEARWPAVCGGAGRGGGAVAGGVQRQRLWEREGRAVVILALS